MSFQAKKNVYVSVSYSERFLRFYCIIPKFSKRKGYYILFLIPVLIVQVTKLVQFTQYNAFSKIPPSASVHFASRVRTWRVARLYSEIALSRKQFGIGHMYIYTFFLKMTDTMTSQNICLSSWVTLCILSDAFPSGFPLTTLYALFFSLLRTIWPA
jgi:hypothetical protein